MSDIRIDDDGFLVGDGEQQRTEAENVLMKEIKTDTTTIVSLLKGTVKLQRDALKATQSAVSKPKGNHANANSGQPSRVNLVHPNRATPPSPSNGQPAPIPPTVRPNRQGAGANQPPTPQGSSSNAGSPDTARANRQRGANGRFISDSTPASGEGAQGGGNRDSRGRFTGGNGGNADERSAVSRITDSLKDLNGTLSINADTTRIDPMVDAIKEAGSVISTGVEAGKKVLSVGNTLIAKPAMALGRGIKGLFKPKTDAINSPTAWYKRIWRTLERGNRQDQTQHAQEQRRLDELVRGQGQGGGSGNSSLLMMLGLGLAGLLAAIKNIKIPSLDEFKKKFKELGTDNESPIPIRRIPKLPTPALPPTRFQSWMTKLGETKVGKALGAFAKRVPFITSALEAGAGGINAVNIDNDKNLTDAEKERAQAANAGRTTGAIAGGFSGTTAGMAAGAAIGSAFPIIGTAIGTVVGGLVGSWLGATGGRIVGEKVGGWVDDLANADIAGRMSNAWDAFLTPLTPMFADIKSWTISTWQKTQDIALGMWESVTIDAKATWSTITSGWDGLIASVSAGFESIANAATAFNTWFKDKTGIDIGENLTRSKDAVVDAVSRHVVPVVVGMGESLAINAKANTERLKNNAASLWQGVKDAPIVQAVGGAWNGLTGETAKEKAKRERNLNTTGYNAYKNVLEGEYSKNGFKDVQAQAFLKGQVQQESNFDATKINKKSGAFGSTQFMPATAKQYGVMQGSSPEAVQSQANGQARYMSTLLKRYGGDWDKALAGYNYGEGNVDKKLKIAKEKGVDWKTLLPQETKDYLVRVKQNAMNFGAVSASQAPTVSPKTTTTPMTNIATNAVPTMKAAPVNAVPVPNVQSIQSVQAKEQPTRHNTTPSPIKVSFAKPLVGQNVSDRGIAHILTGGIGETA